MMSWRLTKTPHQKAADISHVPNQPNSRLLNTRLATSTTVRKIA